MDKDSIQTTKLDYELNEISLQSEFKFLLITIPQNGFSEFHHFLNDVSVEAITTVNKAKYLVMLPLTTTLPKFHQLQAKWLPLSEANASGVYSNHLLNLLLNREAIGEFAPTRASTSPGLLIVGSGWLWKRRDGMRQCHALSVKVGWQNDLELTVKTFTETESPKPSDTCYLLDKGRQCLFRCARTDAKLVFVSGNHTNHRNQVKFLSMQDESHYLQSKVGIAHSLIRNINQHCQRFFTQLITFHESPVTVKSRLRLRAVASIWEQIGSNPINIYAQADDPLCTELADRIQLALQSSKIVTKAGVKALRNHHSISGWNIQVVRDHRDGHDTDRYELSSGTTVIQHVTVENFGAYDDDSEELGWLANDQVARSDPGADPALVKVAQELVIKRDLTMGRLSIVDVHLQSLLHNYQFYTFQFLHTLPQPEVMVIKLSVDNIGQLSFCQKLVNLNALQADDNDTRLCAEVFECLYRKKKAYFWDRVACVVTHDVDRFLIEKTDRTTMPKGQIIAHKLQQSNHQKELTKDQVREAFETISIELKDDPDALATLNQMEQIVSNQRRSFTLGALDNAFREDGIVPKQAATRHINELLEARTTFTFKDTLQREMPDSPVAGLKGIGLTKIGREWDYFVGSNLSLKRNIPRGNVLRRIYPLAGDDQSIIDAFPDLVAMMAVEFVRSGQYTVVPFPVKYMREYWNFQVRRHPQWRRQ